jgi:hypothetical protein
LDMRLSGFKLSMLFALGILLLASAPEADAAAALRFTYDGGAPITCSDNDITCDTSALVGVVSFNSNIGAFLVNVTTGVTKPVFAEPHMDLNSINVQTGAGAHTLVMEFSDDNFSVPAPSFLLAFGGTLSNPAGSTITANAYLDNANALFSKAQPIGQLGPFGPGAFSGSTIGPGTADTSYSLTQVLSLSTTGPGSFSGDLELTGVPEPTSVALFGGVLLLTGTALRRKVAKKA